MPEIITTPCPDKWFSADEMLNNLYPAAMRTLAYRHWTPLSISSQVIDFLVPENGVRILDIGSGVGKFCLAGGYHKPGADFTGIEQRQNLVRHAEKALDKVGLTNVHFLNNNFTRLNFKEYDHFYFFNAFYENLTCSDKIDNSIAYTNGLYYYYCRCLCKKLDDMPAGTRIVTFHSLGDEIPLSYQLIETCAENLLKFWMKH